MIQSQVQPRRWPDPEIADDVSKAESAFSTARRVATGSTPADEDERHKRAVRTVIEEHGLSLDAAKDLVEIVTTREV